MGQKSFLFFVLILAPCRLYSEVQNITLSMPIIQPTLYSVSSKRVLDRAYSQIKVEVKYERYPANRSLYAANRGVTDGILARIPNMERSYPNLTMLPIPLASEKVYVYTHDLHFRIYDWRVISRYRVAIVRGFELATKHLNKDSLVEVPSVEQAFSMLEQKKVDFVIDLESGQCVLNKLGLNKIRRLEPAISELTVYHYLHIRHQSLSRELKVILESMALSGEIRSIYDNTLEELDCVRPIAQ